MYTLWQFYESLTRVSPDGDVSGLLATGWENIDKLTWRFTLRPGVKFHNGKTFNAKSVAAQINHLVNSEEVHGTVAYSTNQRQAKITNARVIDDLTVEFTTSVPNPELPRQMAGFWMPDSEARDALGLKGFNRQPIGTGPYKVVNFKPGEVNYEAYEGAWRPAKVKFIKTVELAEAATRVTSILSGEVDISQGVPMDAIDRLKNENHKVDIAARPSVFDWRFMSVRKGIPFSDKRVRQAANYAIDRDAINKHFFGGITVAGSQCATRKTFGCNPAVEPYPYDPEKAKAPLTEAGYPNGFDTGAMVTTGAFPADKDIYQFTAQQLSAVGIRTTINVIQFAEWLDRWYGRKKGPEGGMGFDHISRIPATTTTRFHSMPIRT